METPSPTGNFSGSADFILGTAVFGCRRYFTVTAQRKADFLKVAIP